MLKHSLRTANSGDQHHSNFHPKVSNKKGGDYTKGIEHLPEKVRRMSKSETVPASILVVDDFPDWRAKVRSMLQAVPEWKIIFQAVDGQEGVQKAAELHPDIVLLDIGLPHLNGIEAAKRIRQDSPESKVIFVTTNGIPDIKTAAMETGAVAYVLKQDAGNELIPAIARALYDYPLELSGV